MTEGKVEYVKATAREAGAIPEGTVAATHPRAGDGAEIQDVYINGVDSLPLPAGAATSAKQDLLLTELEKKADLTETQPVILVDGAGAAIGVSPNKLYVNAELSEQDNAVLDDISSNQTNGSQKTQLVDGSGITLSITSRRLDVNALPYDVQISKYAKIDPMREIAVVEPQRLVGTSFSGTVRDSNFWTDAISGTGAKITQAGQTILECGTSSGGYAVSSSVRSSRYSAGCANFFRAVVQMPVAGLANHRTRWGAFTVATRVPQDGFFFETEGTILYINHVNANSTNPPISNRISMAGLVTPFILDTNVHTYEIVYTNSSAWFYVDDILRYQITGNSAPMCQTYSLPINLQNISITSTTNFILNVRVASIFRFGNFRTAPTCYHVTGAVAGLVLKRGAGVIHRVIVNNPTAQSITLYDATSATNPVAVVATLANSSPCTLEYGCPFNTGLTITVSGIIDATIIYE